MVSHYSMGRQEMDMENDIWTRGACIRVVDVCILVDFGSLSLYCSALS